MAVVSGAVGLPESTSAFHYGQQLVQTQVGVRETSEKLGRFIRTYMNDQAKDFFAELPLLFSGVKNEDGTVWATTLSGQPGFIKALDDYHLRIQLKQVYADPAEVRAGHALGCVGVMQHNRRRNKLNGIVESVGPEELVLRVTQSLGNCPKYIQVRSVKICDKKLASLGREKRNVSEGGSALGPEQRAFIARCDTAFLASCFPQPDKYTGASETCTCNHRGGAPGFVQVTDAGELLIPDYIGNNMFQTYGNISASPAAGLQFIDFESGDTLQLTGMAEILYSCRTLPGAQRTLKFVISRWVHIQGALPILTEGEVEPSPYNPLPEDKATVSGLKLVGRWEESHDITTFEFVAPTAHPGKAFCEAGQFASFDFPNIIKGETLNRTWTISSCPTRVAKTGRFTISVKKAGRVSGFLHDSLALGQEVIFRGVDGDFTLNKAAKCIPPSGVLLIAGGIGITPMRVMFSEAIRRGYPVTLLYTFRTMKDAAFLKEFQEGALKNENVKLVVALTGEDSVEIEGGSVVTGRPNAALIKKICPDVLEREIFQCGPTPMMNAVVSALESLGVSTTRIHQESFNF